MTKVVSIYPNFSNKGGAQNVVLQLARQLNEREGIILTNTPTSEVPKDYFQEGIRFEKLSWRNVLRLWDKDTILLSHHRRTTTLLLLLRLFGVRRLRIVHVAHNTFHSLKWLTLFPKHIVAVSQGVKDNLQQYFRVPARHIQVIYNGLRDVSSPSLACGKEIKILLLGRLTSVKQQVELVKRTMGRLPEDICITFAGEGADKDDLLNLIENSSQYEYIGQIEVNRTLPHYDYICLFSKKEGLPLSLIEGCMFSKPLITNSIAPVLEVNKQGYNGFVFSSWEALIEGLQHLPNRETEEYKEMSWNARKQYEEYFTEPKMIEQYRQYLQTI